MDQIPVLKHLNTLLAALAVQAPAVTCDRKKTLYKAVDGTWWVDWQGGGVPEPVALEAIASGRLQRRFVGPGVPAIDCWVLKEL